MQTMKNTVNPAMLKQLANIPPAPPRKEREEPIRPGRMAPVAEDVHMRTVKHEAVMEKPKGLEEWEKRLVESADSKRKATVAQLCEYLLVDCEMMLTEQTSWNTTVRYNTPYTLLSSHTDHQSIYSDTFQTERRDSRHSRPIPPSDRSASLPTCSSVSWYQVSGPEYAKEVQSYNGRERVLLRKRRTKLRVEQFRIIAQVGQGGYGSVYLARKIDTREVCALKKMRKGTLAKMDEVKHVLVERDILTAVKTPWLVKLLYAFQDVEHVYLAMVRAPFRGMSEADVQEYVPGGDFRTLLNNSGVLKEEHAKFYAAEMFMGVNELHKLGYIHRDLKPEVRHHYKREHRW
jgi:hypothetical protein